MFRRFPSRTLAGLSLLAALSGCTAKADVAPDESGCATVATVRFCYSKTSTCLTEHTTLELADGTRLRPSGAVWKAYLPQQFAGQIVRIGYTLTSRTHMTPTESGFRNANISCLTSYGSRGGNK